MPKEDIQHIIGELQQTIGDLRQTVGELKGTTITGFSNVNRRLEEMKDCADKQNRKINDLETFKDNLTGKLGVIGMIAGVIGSIITMIINYFIKNS
jgi:hypothetical protein